MFFLYQGFLSWALTAHRTAHSTTSTRSRTFRHLFATLHVKWLSHIFNCTDCSYRTATRWELPPNQITIWLIDDVTLVLVCLRDDLILAFFVAAIWDGKPVDSNSKSTITLLLQANRLTKSANHPKTQNSSVKTQSICKPVSKPVHFMMA